jgi:pectinesterase
MSISAVKAQAPATSKDLKVAQDGSGDFKTIQEAVNSTRDLGPRQIIIHIKKGIYHEKLIIPSWKTRISLIGESLDNTVITNNDYSGKTPVHGKDEYGRTQMSTYTSYTVLVQGDDFHAENITVENTAGRVGQAVALHVEADRCSFLHCRFLGNQDTMYLARGNSRQYYNDCYIEGTTDFIFGEATVIFEHCTVKSLVNSYITAAATTRQQVYGFVFLNCTLVTDSAADKVYLGRPWRPYAKTVFINTEMGSHIVAEGWHAWPGDAMFPDKDKTAYYAEYASKGPGGKSGNRVAWSKQLTQKQAKMYTIKNILAGQDGWMPENAKNEN